MSRSFGKRRLHWEVTGPYRDGTWGIQRAIPDEVGYTFDKPRPEHSGFRTKKEALAFKREHNL